MGINEYLNQGLHYHQNSQLEKAAFLYKKVLQLDQKNHDAHYLLAMTAYQSRRFHQALNHIQRALELKVFPHYLYNLANIYYELKQFKLAIHNYSLVIRVAPDFVDAYINLGLLFKQVGQINEALNCYQRALKLQPQNSLIYHNLALIFQDQGTIAKAIEYFNQTLKLKPDLQEAQLNLADLYHQSNKFEQAERHYKIALKLKATPQFYLKLGKNHWQQTQKKLAIEAYEQAIKLDPNFHQSYYYLAEAIQGKMPQSLEEALYVLEKVSNNNHLQTMLSFYEVKNNQRAKALQRLEKIIEQDEENSGAYYQLGHLVMNLGQMEAAYLYFKKILSLSSLTPSLEEQEYEKMSVHSNLLFALRAMPQKNQGLYFKTIQEWEKKYMQPYYPQESIQRDNNQPEKRLKIGYVSGDFRTHSAAAVFELLFEHHDRQQVEIYAYSDLKDEDSKTLYFKELVNHWRPINQASDEQMALLIEKDKIDILVDLSGHTANNRLGVFARKVAPIQVTGLGFGCTSGLKTMDYQWSDPYLVLPEETKLNSEKLFYLKNLVCWLPPRWTLTLAKPPFLTNGYITFGCGNSLAKINTQVIECWAGILKSVPDSQLHLKTLQFEDEYAKEYIHQQFEGHNLNRERVKLIGKTSQKEHLEFYQTLDIALDPFPWSGGISTLETLWMGAPVITLNEGLKTSASLLYNLGYADFVASSKKGYIDFATQLAHQPGQLQEFRKTIRSKLWHSNICNGKRFAREIEASYRIMWRKYLNLP